MKSNLQLQKDVMDELRWTPMLNVADIGVTAKDGVVTLTGTVDSYSKKRGHEALLGHIVMQPSCSGLRAIHRVEERSHPASTDRHVSRPFCAWSWGQYVS